MKENETLEYKKTWLYNLAMDWRLCHNENRNKENVLDFAEWLAHQLHNVTLKKDLKDIKFKDIEKILGDSFIGEMILDYIRKKIEEKE